MKSNIGKEYRNPPNTEAELNNILTEPNEQSINAVKQLNSDIAIIGVGGKMGPTMAVLAKRSIEAAGLKHKVVGVSRFSSGNLQAELESQGVETIACDILDRTALQELPDFKNVVYLAGMKFGTSNNPSAAWAMNCLAPALVAEKFAASRIVALSSGNVYPFVPVDSKGATEETAPQPVGEYAQSCLGRERMFDYFSRKNNTPVTLIRLNYALDLRYGVLLDIAQNIMNNEPVDATMGYFNAVWQGYANAVVLSAFSIAEAPPTILNLTGTEIASIRETAERMAGLLGKEKALFAGAETGLSLLNNAEKCHKLFGAPSINLDTLIEWQAHWLKSNGTTLGKPTHFETTDGKF